MKKSIDGVLYEMIPEEIAELEAQAEAAERDYWINTSYDEAVNAKIRERYTESQEFAIQRQKSKKPQEFEEYDTYCEDCKAYVKAKKAQYGVEV